MKYTLRFVWYVLRIVIIAASAFAILVVAFFVAMDSANVYVIVSDGMKARAAAVLMPDQSTDLTKYFTDRFIKSQPTNAGSAYQGFAVTDFTYNLSVESLWCNPWKNTASVTIVESIPDIVSSASQADSDAAAGTKAPALPKWQRARYKISCIRIGGFWRIDNITKIEDLQPEPTPSPEPSSYITASPVPTTTSKLTASPSPTTSK